jgi:hypothetical protein
LFAFGLLGGTTVAILIITGGALGRSAYTLGRMIQSAAHGYEKPWVALVVGVMPLVGNLAYPAQMIYSAGGKDEKLARFMMDDGLPGSLGIYQFGEGRIPGLSIYLIVSSRFQSIP